MQHQESDFPRYRDVWEKVSLSHLPKILDFGWLEYFVLSWANCNHFKIVYQPCQDSIFQEFLYKRIGFVIFRLKLQCSQLSSFLDVVDVCVELSTQNYVICNRSLWNMYVWLYGSVLWHDGVLEGKITDKLSRYQNRVHWKGLEPHYIRHPTSEFLN
jgi:hypothetical protein